MGALRYEQDISGGGGMGINYVGSVLGGLLFGTAGALIGSRYKKEINEIKSQTIEVDTRIILVKLYNENKDIMDMLFKIENLEAFDWFIPDKEYSYVIKIEEMHL